MLCGTEAALRAVSAPGGGKGSEGWRPCPRGSSSETQKQLVSSELVLGGDSAGAGAAVTDTTMGVTIEADCLRSEGKSVPSVVSWVGVCGLGRRVSPASLSAAGFAGISVSLADRLCLPLHRMVSLMSVCPHMSPFIMSPV